MRFVIMILLRDFVIYEPFKNAFHYDGDEFQFFNDDVEQLSDGGEYLYLIDEFDTFVPIFSDDDVSKKLINDGGAEELIVSYCDAL